MGRMSFACRGSGLRPFTMQIVVLRRNSDVLRMSCRPIVLIIWRRYSYDFVPLDPAAFPSGVVNNPNPAYPAKRQTNLSVSQIHNTPDRPKSRTCDTV